MTGPLEYGYAPERMQTPDEATGFIAPEVLTTDEILLAASERLVELTVTRAATLPPELQALYELAVDGQTGCS